MNFPSTVIRQNYVVNKFQGVIRIFWMCFFMVFVLRSSPDHTPFMVKLTYFHCLPIFYLISYELALDFEGVDPSREADLNM